MSRKNNTNLMDAPKAVIYARYSSHNQTEQSIEGQLRVNHEYAKREGMIVIGEYIDRAISGTKADTRPEFQRMIHDAKKRQFEYVIVYKLDRFARNRYDSAIYKYKLKECGVKLVSATENISDNPEGIILEAVLEASAEYYSKELSQKVKRGMRETMLKGSFTGGTAPIGYKVVNKKIVIDDEKADIIRYAFNEYSNGKPKKEIMKELNEKGIRNNKGKPLCLTSLQHALRNKKYIGIATYAGVDYEGIYPPIIDNETFYKVQNRLSLLAHAPAKGKARHEYLLHGKAFCGMCGTKLVGDAGTGKSGMMYHYYSCGARKKSHTCKKKSEAKDFLEWYVTEQTIEYVLTPKRMDYIAKRLVEEYDKEFSNSRILSYEKRIKRLENDADKIFKLILATDDNNLIKRYEQQVIALDLQREDLEIDLAKLRLADGIRYTEKDILVWLKQFCKGDLMDENFRRKIIDVFISSIYVYDDKLVIYYNIKNGKQISYIDNCNALDEFEYMTNCENVRVLDKSGNQAFLFLCK